MDARFESTLSRKSTPPHGVGSTHSGRVQVFELQLLLRHSRKDVHAAPSLFTFAHTPEGLEEVAVQ